MRIAAAVAAVHVLACSGSKDSAPKSDLEKGKAEQGSGTVPAPVVDTEEESVKLALKAIGDRAVAYQRDKGGYLEGKVGPTPAKACCDQPKGQCYQQDTDWSDPVWTALGWKESVMYTRYRYSYEGSKLTFTVTATADVNCDGHPVSYRIAGAYDEHNMAFLTQPEKVTP